MNPCLSISSLQGFLEEPGPPSAESHLTSCFRCRAAFERIGATNRRANSWLSKLWSPAEALEIDVAEALPHLLRRASSASMQRTNPWAMGSSLVIQSAVVGLLLLAGGTQTAHRIFVETPLILSPRPAKPIPIRQSRSAGGGGGTPLPPPKGSPARSEPKVFTAAIPTVANPILVMNEAILAPPDVWSAPDVAGRGLPFGLPGATGGYGNRGTSGVGDGLGGDGGSVPAFTVGNGITAPVLISRVDPEYSEEARKARYNGTVELSIVVNPDGLAGDIRVIKSVGMGLDEKAIEAVRQWRFKPGRNKGIAVRTRAMVQVNFRLL